MKAKTNKPQKPNAEFHLFAANNGQWAKKIRGKKHYFGVWADPDSALEKYLYERDYLTQGLAVPGVADPSEFTVADAVNGFLNDRMDRLNSGELAQQTFSQYERYGKIVAASLGRVTPLSAISPDMLKKLRRELAATRSPVALKGAITCCRMILNHLYDDEQTDKPVRFGKSFDTPKNGRWQMTRTQLRTDLSWNLQPSVRYCGVMRRSIWLAMVITCRCSRRKCCRRYGGYSNLHRQRYLAECRELLNPDGVDSTAEPTTELTVDAARDDVPDASPAAEPVSDRAERCCPNCGEPMFRIEATARPSWSIVLHGRDRPHWYADG